MNLQKYRRKKSSAGNFLVVLGPDGVGKTTLITGLHDQLALLKNQELESIHLLHFRPHLLPNINQLLTGKAEVIGEFNDPHSAPAAGQISSLFRIVYYSFDYIFGYWLKLRQKINSGHTIIFDRYFYDFIIDPRRSRLSLPEWLPRLFLLIIPKPDLVFVLDAPAYEIYKRKQELPLDEIERQLCAYRLLVAESASQFIRIDSSQSPEIMVKFALIELSQLSKKF